MAERLDKEMNDSTEELVDLMDRPEEEQVGERLPKSAEGAKKPARGRRKAAAPVELPMPAELEGNVQFEGLSPSWKQLYTAVNRAVKR